jgi:hypothetical protein
VACANADPKERRTAAASAARIFMVRVAYNAGR